MEGKTKDFNAVLEMIENAKTKMLERSSAEQGLTTRIEFMDCYGDCWTVVEFNTEAAGYIGETLHWVHERFPEFEETARFSPEYACAVMNIDSFKSDFRENNIAYYAKTEKCGVLYSLLIDANGYPENFVDVVLVSEESNDAIREVLNKSVGDCKDDNDWKEIMEDKFMPFNLIKNIFLDKGESPIRSARIAEHLLYAFHLCTVRDNETQAKVEKFKKFVKLALEL